MFSHLSNDELARKLFTYTGSAAPSTVIPVALLEEVAKRLQNDPDFRPMR